MTPQIEHRRDRAHARVVIARHQLGLDGLEAREIVSELDAVLRSVEHRRARAPSPCIARARRMRRERARRRVDAGGGGSSKLSTSSSLPSESRGGVEFVVTARNAGREMPFTNV